MAWITYDRILIRDTQSDLVLNATECVDRYNDLRAPLAAATTLERLREVVPEHAGAWCEECCACVVLDDYLNCSVCCETPDSETHATWFMNKLQDILYPQPQPPEATP